MESAGKPAFESAEQAYTECAKLASEQKKKEFAETGSTWAAALENYRTAVGYC